VCIIRSAAFLEKGDGEAALQEALETIRLDENWAKAYYRKGQALMALSQLQEASESYKKGLELQPENSDLRAAQDEIVGHLIEVEIEEAAKKARENPGSNR